MAKRNTHPCCRITHICYNEAGHKTGETGFLQCGSQYSKGEVLFIEAGFNISKWFAYDRHQFEIALHKDVREGDLEATDSAESPTSVSHQSI